MNLKKKNHRLFNKKIKQMKQLIIKKIKDVLHLFVCGNTRKIFKKNCNSPANLIHFVTSLAQLTRFIFKYLLLLLLLLLFWNNRLR